MSRRAEPVILEANGITKGAVGDNPTIVGLLVDAGAIHVYVESHDDGEETLEFLVVHPGEVIPQMLGRVGWRSVGAVMLPIHGPRIVYTKTPLL